MPGLKSCVELLLLFPVNFGLILAVKSDIFCVCVVSVKLLGSVTLDTLSNGPLLPGLKPYGVLKEEFECSTSHRQ